MSHITRCRCPYCHSDVTDLGTQNVLGCTVQLFECSGCGGILEANQLAEELPIDTEVEA
jgi:hypothetical protein